MYIFKLLNSIVITILFFVCVACNTSEPKAEIISVDSSGSQASLYEEINDEPPQPPVRLPLYDGTIETARKQVNEIMDAIENKRLSGYSYLYNNNSGEGELRGVLYFSADDDFLGKGRDWYLKLYNDFYALEYFFDDKMDLFAVRQWKYGSEPKLVAEIFYKEMEGVIEGSWLQRTEEEKVDLATYTGDFWADFLEGYPMYATTKRMKADPSLQYQQ